MARVLPSGFEVLRVSDLAFNAMTTEIVFEGEQIARLHMDKGATNVEVELFTKFTKRDFVPRFPLAALLEALAIGRELLLEYPDPTKMGSR